MEANVASAVSSYLNDVYGVVGKVSTAVEGVNWTLAVVENGQAVAFARLYRPSGRSPADVAAELAVLQAVEGTAVLDVSRPLADRRGRAFSEIELPDGTRRMLAVFSPALGRELAPTPSDYRRAGLALADLHGQRELASLAPARDIGSERGAQETLGMLAGRFPQAIRTIAEAMGTLRRLGADRVVGPVGFCHGDMGPLNMRIDGERVTFFDFDDCGRGPQLLDVAAMAFWLEAGQQEGPAAALWQALLEGYGMADGEAVALFVRWLMVNHQVRILRFLADYCTLDDDLWREALEDAGRLAESAAVGDLKVLRSE